MNAHPRESLARCPLFAGLDAPTLIEVGESATIRTVDRGRTLFHEGDAAEIFYVVLDGRLKLTQTTPDGQEVIVRYVGAGEMCAVVALFHDSEYPASAEAVDSTAVAAWDRGGLEALVRRHPQLALNAIHILAERLDELTTRVRELATEKVARRVARALLRLARKAGRKVDDGVLLDLPLSRQDLAAMTGTTLFTVSRLLAEWEREGLVDTGRERVVIRLPHGLVAIAEDLPGDGRDADSPDPV